LDGGRYFAVINAPLEHCQPGKAVPALIKLCQPRTFSPGERVFKPA
jgi:hypothetical protein